MKAQTASGLRRTRSLAAYCTGWSCLLLPRCGLVKCSLGLERRQSQEVNGPGLSLGFCLTCPPPPGREGQGGGISDLVMAASVSKGQMFFFFFQESVS